MPVYSSSAPLSTVAVAAELLPQWQLQEAKNRLSAVVKAAAQGQPQVVTVHGQAAAVVLSPERYAALLEGCAPRHALSAELACPVLGEDDEQLLFTRDRSSNARRDLPL